MNYTHDVYRHISAQNLTVGSAAAASTASVAAQTRFVRLTPVLTSSVQPSGGVYYAISEGGAAAVTSATGTFLPAAWVEIVKITPGQKVQALASGGSVTVLNVSEETD